MVPQLITPETGPASNDPARVYFEDRCIEDAMEVFMYRYTVPTADDILPRLSDIIDPDSDTLFVLTTTAGTPSWEVLRPENPWDFLDLIEEITAMATRHLGFPDNGVLPARIGRSIYRMISRALWEQHRKLALFEDMWPDDEEGVEIPDAGGILESGEESDDQPDDKIDEPPF